MTIDYDRVDLEARSLVKALNALPGITTKESCCGHGKRPFCIWFDVDEMHSPGFMCLARCTCPRYYGYRRGTWEVKLYHSDVNPVTFVLEGPKGPVAYDMAERLAANIMEHVEGNPGYNILHWGLNQYPGTKGNSIQWTRRNMNMGG